MATEADLELIEAAKKGSDDRFDAALKAGADARARDSWGGTALAYAAQQGRLDWVRRLLKLGADASLANKSGDTALHFACKETDDAELVELLLEAGAPLHGKGFCGLTPLHFAVDEKRYVVAAVLVRRGADPTLKDGFKRTAFDYANSKSRKILEGKAAATPQAAAKPKPGEPSKTKGPTKPVALPAIPKPPAAYAPLESLATWDACALNARAAMAEALARALGEDWTLGRKAVGVYGLVELLHEPTGARFLAVPGGAFVAGMRPADLEVAAGLDFGEFEAKEVLAPFKKQKPRPVAVRAFLCGRVPLLEGKARALRLKTESWGNAGPAQPARFAPKNAKAALAVLPKDFRLLSGDEWEYAARSGGADVFVSGADARQAEAACAALHEKPFDPERKDAGSNSLGIWGLPWGDWVAGSGPRTLGKGRGGAAVGYPWQGPGIIECLAGAGATFAQGDANCLRFAVDLTD